MKSYPLRDVRKRKGWTQDELAARSGIDQTTISCLEIGRATRPTFATVFKLAKALGVRPEQLAFGADESVSA